MTLYATLTELKDEVDETTSDHDAQLNRDLEDASRAVDLLFRVPEDHFVAGSSVAKTFDVSDSGALLLSPDLWSLDASGLKTDEDGDGTFETTWSSTDYILYPLSGPPYFEIQVDRVNGVYRFPKGQRRAQVTGSWGAAASVPGPIRRMTLLIANRYRVRPNTPEGIQNSAENMMALAAIDPDVQMYIEESGYLNHRTVFV